MWFRTLFDSMKQRRSGTPVRRTPRRPTASRLRVEALEDRSVPALYAVTDLGTLGGDYSYAYDLNQAGQVVGYSGHAFLWNNGTMIDLGTLGGSYSSADGINELGQVVGWANLPAEASQHAFLVTPQDGVWFQDSDLDGRNDFMIDLGTLNGSDYSEATDINNAGQVVGGSGGHAFLWDAVHGMTDLGVPPGFTESYAGGINEAGQVTGSAWYYDPLSGSHHSAFLWDAASGMTVLGAGPGYTDSQAAALNEAGQVVGYQGSAFLWTPDSPNGHTGSFADLGTLPGDIDSNAAAINNAGQVVGSSTVVETVYVCDTYCDEYGCWEYCYNQDYYYSHAFYWDAAGGMVNLQAQLVPGSGATLENAVAINDSGVIAVNGYGLAYLLTPLPPGTPSISIADAPALTEGNAGTTLAVFTVTLSNPSSDSVTVAYATADSGATAGSDYQAVFGTLTFAPNETSKTISVPVNGDRLAEPDEMFVVNLSSPTNAWIAGGQGLATILDDEPRITISDRTVTEGNTGSVSATFTVTLSHVYDEDVVVPYTTANGSATAGSDYMAASASVIIPAGLTSNTFTVMVIGDGVSEATETYYVNLGSPANAAIVDGQGVGTILDDEPRVSINDVTMKEGNSGLTAFAFTVRLSVAYDVPVTVDYATADSTATAGSDYQAVSGTLTIPAGQTTGTITVWVNGDRLAEPNKTFLVNLSNLNFGAIADSQGFGSIVDDEPRISISDVTKREGRKNTTSFVFTVTLSPAYDQAVTVSYRTADGTATTSDNDYVAQTGTLTFLPGETTKTITIVVNGDSKMEADETFYLDLFGNSSNALFTKSRGVGTILNDDRS
jgi:probable HAF family extracellular repeat protein